MDDFTKNERSLADAQGWALVDVYDVRGYFAYMVAPAPNSRMTTPHEAAMFVWQRARAGDWPYNLYCMVHGRDRDSVRATVAQAVAHAGLAHRPHAMLFSLRRFKQTGARRFAAHTTHLAAHSCHTPAGAPHAHP